MSVSVDGKERTDKEWKTLFLDAGFTCCKITTTFGLKSLIKVYPLKNWTIALMPARIYYSESPIILFKW